MSENSLSSRCAAGFNPDSDPNNNEEPPITKKIDDDDNQKFKENAKTPENFAVPDFAGLDQQLNESKEIIAPKVSTTEKQVDFAEDTFTYPSHSLDNKIPRSGSLFVRISDSSVDQARMAEFDKMEKDIKNMELSKKVVTNNPTEEEGDKNLPNNELPQVQEIIDENQQSDNGNATSPPIKNIIKMHETALKPPAMNSKTIKTGGGSNKSGSGTQKNKEPPSNSTNSMKSVKPTKPPPNTRPRHVLTVELTGGRNKASLKDKSPYACKIVQLPPNQSSRERSRSKNKKKVWVCQRDHQLLEDQIQGHEKQIPPTEKMEENEAAAQNPPFDEKLNQPKSSNLYSTTESIPLTQWPNFQSSQQKGENSQCDLSSPFPSTYPHQNNYSLASAAPSTLTPTLLPIINNQQVNAATAADVVAGEINSNDPSSSFPSALKEMADLVERGIFTASETCNVIINTVFKESLRDPASLERVMESKDFHAFLQSGNEITALEKCAAILTASSQVINEYLDAIKTSGVTVPSDTNFSRKSSGVVCVTTSKKNFTLAEAKKKYNNASESRVWSFVPPTSTQEKFQLALFLNQETGEIMQTISCQDHIFRMRYSISPLESQIRGIISASREQVGLPAFVKPDSLLATIIRCSSFALTRLTKAKTLLSRCNQKLGEFFQEIAKSKYVISIAKLNKLDHLRRKLQSLNVTCGIIYQMALELTEACSKIQNGLWNSMHVLSSLQFSGFSGGGSCGYNINSIIKKEQGSTSTSSQPMQKIPAHEAMILLTEGIRGIDSSIRLGIFSIETVGSGVKLGKGQKKLLKEYLDGARTLGSEKDVDYGSLLMTVLCSAEMMNHFVDVCPSTVDKSVRGAILVDLNKINSGMTELCGIVKRMMTDSKILAMRTTFKLRELKNRYKEEYGANI